MFYMETVYLQMAASRERELANKELLRAQDEHDDRPKARCSAQARSGHEDAPRQTRPYTGGFPNGTWRMQSWRGAGW
jgi:hypothetical protein